jgi:hypothetical protein
VIGAPPPRGGRLRGAVQAAVSAAHWTRPAAGAGARDQAVWWARTAGALDLLADHEADPVRAEAAHADAVTARRLAAGMAAAHAAGLAGPAATPPAPVRTLVDEAAAAEGTATGAAGPAPDVADVDVHELDVWEAAL